ncbi:MAG: hypothetical protein AUJ52_14725 [Elusimicrobia bacterium CG1_02_63_36]|nr:MAG: hypothetical protein AUJ52_14725 [Elusimicrobia bacterium CG1_02_63_36]PIP83867.1 MAG: hypothetical protein COR54_07260 [Elusimicrobia bacterium CG22_combo_CG10-13_8_21_14_all_63_91]PJA17565.1 MAG: hypothetical protein COX66_04020 [Elusimicrobia bacterium CG_4_10_14_0_2_um_filter_63_34]PJB25654.1 MAG: hypothetical protein CO113_07530 [Elusimicrobia bacterium CG_4_9_14_3_um_filter_62_55]
MRTPDPSAEADAAQEERAPRLSPVLVYLLKGVLYRDQHPRVWHDLEALEGKVVDYFKTIGLELMVDESEGFAYLKQTPLDEDDDMPRLIQRRPLSYPVSVLCVLLRKKLVEADAGSGESRVVLTRDQIVEMMRVFSPQRADEAFTEDQIEAHIRKAVDLDLLKALKADPPVYEVRPIIKALVDADWLQNLDERIEAYQKHGNSPA